MNGARTNDSSLFGRIADPSGHLREREWPIIERLDHPEQLLGVAGRDRRHTPNPRKNPVTGVKRNRAESALVADSNLVRSVAGELVREHAGFRNAGSGERAGHGLGHRRRASDQERLTVEAVHELAEYVGVEVA